MHVLIFGTGSYMKKVKNALKNNIEIVAFIDNQNTVKYIENILVISPDEIYKFEFDYIIIASMYSNEMHQQLLRLNIERKKIIDIFDFINNTISPYLIFKCRLDKFLNLNQADGIITGMSYFKYGINTEHLKNKMYNFSWDAQDLFYDYMIAKYIINNFRKKIKYAFVGLSIYSFEHDFSKTEYASFLTFHLMYSYYKIFNEFHNMKLNKLLNDQIYKYDFIFSLFDENKLSIFVDQDDIWNYSKNKDILIENNLVLNDYVKKMNKKNYIQTRKENKKIFETYIKMLIKNEVKPVVILLPLSIELNNQTSRILKNDFYNIISELKENLNFNFLDYSEIGLDNSYFYDYHHLNSNGALYITDLINKEAF